MIDRGKVDAAGNLTLTVFFAGGNATLEAVLKTQGDQKLTGAGMLGATPVTIRLGRIR